MAYCGMIDKMQAPTELSSLASSLEELTKRLTVIAEAASDSQMEDLATELFGVERSLTGALRRLRRLSDARSS